MSLPGLAVREREPEYRAKWEFHGTPLRLHRLPASSAAKAPHYQALLDEPCYPSNSALAILRSLYLHSPKDQKLVKSLFLACVGVFVGEEEARVASIYDQLVLDLFGSSIVPETPFNISVLYRLLRRHVEADKAIPPQRLHEPLIYEPLTPPLPEFTFYLKLKPRAGYRLPATASTEFFPFLYPDGDIAFAFSNGNWATLKLFREVVDAVLGRHLQLQPSDNLDIYRDPQCTISAPENDPLAGNYYIVVHVTQMAKIGRIKKSAVPAPVRSSTFAQKVIFRGCSRCTFSTSSFDRPEDDLQAAHIYPRTGHTFFESTLKQFLPGPSSWVTSIDHPSNGLSLWHALHRLWDADRAAISVSRRCLILKKAKHPLSIIQGTTAARGLLEDLDFPREIKALLQLRFAHTMLVWFATQEFQDLLISSLEDDLEESEMQMDTGKPKLESDEKDASGGNMNDAMQNGGISGTGPTTSTVSRSQPSDSLDSTPTSTTGGTREEDDSVPDEDIPVPEKASHLPGCWCDVDADEFGPCMQLLLGATIFWTALEINGQ